MPSSSLVQPCGVHRLKAALGQSGSPEYVASHIVPLLVHLSGDHLSGGMFRCERRGVLPHSASWLPLLLPHVCDMHDTRRICTCNTLHVSVPRARDPLQRLLEEIYRTPGLVGCLREAVESGQVVDASPIGWFLLRLALQVRSWVCSALRPGSHAE